MELYGQLFSQQYLLPVSWSPQGWEGPVGCWYVVVDAAAQAMRSPSASLLPGQLAHSWLCIPG